ncbi:hypothetical protein HIM_01336 [Hirsutella minnesotensis 3608]|nr:hypothetical protein HIM_01336 [Hirsutella minnesotensis 3608]
MDHLPIPDGAQPPKVPFVGTEFVDDGEFSRYPRRQGMEMELRTWTFTRLSLENYQAFFQTWLYFGCLSKVFQIVGLPINAGEFVNRKEGIVSSACLNAHLDKWRDVAVSHKGSRRRWQILGAIREVLDVMRNTLRGPLQAFRHFLAEQHPDSPVTASWPNIALSIGALGYTIRRVSDDLYAPVSDRWMQSWGVNWVLQARMERSQWCKALITKMLKEVNVDFLVFIGSMPFPRAFENHEECQSTVCCGRIADATQYRVAHALTPCACDSWDMPSSSIKIIRKGGIPLAKWSDHEGLQVVKYRENMPFVAISHVWSDGKGNPDCNALPRCQLQHIQAKVTELYSAPRRDGRPEWTMFGPWKRHSPRDPHRQPAGFWMDTLCVPVAEEHKDLRSKVIKQMRAIYEAADRVLVLDDRVEQLAVSSSICDRAARLVVSNWQSRIWTLQEGVMAQQLFFQFSDRALALPELEEEEIRQRDKGRPSPGFWHRVSHGLLTLLSIGLIFGSEADVPGVDGLFEALMPVAKNRLTTNLEDETVCLATLLRLDPGPLLEVRSRYSSKALAQMPKEERLAEVRRVCDERMRRMLCIIGKFHKALIFNELPRLSTDGFRWAPQSFLGQAGSVSGWSPHSTDELWPERASMVFGQGSPCPDNALGLLVGYPGIMLHSLDPSLIRSGRFYVREKTHKWFQYRVSLIARPEDTAQFDKLGDEGNRQALVTIAVPGHERDGPVAAVFGDLRGVTSDGVRQLRHLCLAKVEVMDWGEMCEEEDGREESETGAGWEEDDEVEEDRNSVNGMCFGDGENDAGDEDDDGDDDSDEEEVDYHDAEEAEDDERDSENSDWVDTDSDSEPVYEGAEPEEAVGDGGQNDPKACEETDSDLESLLDSDADEEDDRYAALLRSNTKRVGLNARDRELPRREQVVFGKVLFSTNNKWCIM